MKFLLLSAALFLAVLSAPHNDAILIEWEQYKVDHNKSYETPEEDVARLEVYLANKQMIEEHNRKYERGETSFTMAVNKFSDWFAEERDRLNGLRVGESKRGGRPFELKPGTSPPESINWVDKGAVTQVENQELCGSCYAFSAVGALEGLMFRTNGSIKSLSAQELVDCSYNMGCDGGFVELCFDYVKKRKGIDNNTTYPYMAVSHHECLANEGVIAASCTGYVEIEKEEQLTKAVGTVGPVSISFAAGNDLYAYHRGVYDGVCAHEINHAMLAVGYGTDKKTGKDYWLVKNSWGVNWGEKGYLRVLRNVNKCDIGNASSYPTYD